MTGIAALSKTVVSTRAGNVASGLLLTTAALLLVGCNLYLTRSRAKQIIQETIESGNSKAETHTAYLQIGTLAWPQVWETEAFDARQFSSPDFKPFETLAALQRLVQAGWITETVVELPPGQGAVRPASGASTSKLYRYTAAPKLIQARIVKNGVTIGIPIGSFQIDEVGAIHHGRVVSYLLLPNESSMFPHYKAREIATDADDDPTAVEYSWHIDFNEFGRILFGGKTNGLSWTDWAQFHKGSSGTWECTNEGWALAQNGGEMMLAPSGSFSTSP